MLKLTAQLAGIISVCEKDQLLSPFCSRAFDLPDQRDGFQIGRYMNKRKKEEKGSWAGFICTLGVIFLLNGIIVRI